MPTATRRRRRRLDEDPEDDSYAEEQSPRRRRRLDDDDEEDEQPARRRRHVEPEDSDEDDDDDVEEAPRRRRRAASDDEEEPSRPARRRASTRAPEGRAGRGPASRRETRRRVASGWGAYERSRAASSDFEARFKPSSELQVVQLLEDGPFHSFARHWVEQGPSDPKRPYICPASVQYLDDEGNPADDDAACPLCEIGHKANSPKAYLNVAVLKPGKPEHAVWEIGSMVSEQLQMIDKGIGRRTSLTDIYLLATTTGSGLNTKYHLEPLFEDDLIDLAEEEDLPLKPLTSKQRDAFELYDDSLYPIPSLSELNKVADDLV